MNFLFFNKLKKIKLISVWADKIKKLPWILGLRAFWIILFLVSIELVFGGVLFYKYAILAIQSEQESVNNSLKFKTDTYQKILTKWEGRKQEFEGYQVEQYLNPFIIIKTKQTSGSAAQKPQSPVIKQ